MEDKFEYDNIDWKVPIERSLLIDKNIKHAELRLYLVLLSYARNKITAFPSRETLADDMNCSVRTIDNLKNNLKNIGLLNWKVNYSGSNIYTLLQYNPIKGKGKENIKSKNIFPVIDIFKDTYKSLCENYYDDLKDYIHSGWIDNKHYFETNGDIRNLNMYYDVHGDNGLKKLQIGFSKLDKYILQEVEFGKFYNSDGSELIPTISLFVKAKVQHDRMIRFASDN